MKKSTCISVAFCAAAVGLALGGAPQARAATEADSSPPQGTPGASTTPPEQARIGRATFQLEKAFSDQFVQGRIDRDALAPLIQTVLQTVPEATRQRAEDHINRVLTVAEDLAPRMTSEQRSEVATPPAADKMTKEQIRFMSSWGWPSFGGWGGMGAFGFPSWGGMGWGGAGWGQPWGRGWGGGWGGGWGVPSGWGGMGNWGGNWGMRNWGGNWGRWW